MKSKAALVTNATRKTLLSNYKIILRSLDRGRIVNPSSRKPKEFTDPLDDSTNAYLERKNIKTSGLDEAWKSTVKHLFRSALQTHDEGTPISATKQREQLRNLKNLSSEYAAMVSAVQTHEKLLEDCGWGVTRSQVKQITRTAQRCGLELPNSGVVFSSEAPARYSADEAAFPSAQTDPMDSLLERFKQKRSESQ